MNRSVCFLALLLGIASAKSVVEFRAEDPNLTDPKLMPSFSWLTKKSPDGIPLLNIRFLDGGPDDTVSLSRSNPIPPGPNENPLEVDNCIYSGYLKKESTVYVVITGGCAPSMSFEIQFRSSRLRYYMYAVKDGKVRAFMNPFVNNGNARGESVEIPDEVREADERNAGPSDRQRALLPAYTMRLTMNYDSSWSRRFGAGTGSVNAMRRVLAQAQAWFFHPSLTTRVTWLVTAERAFTTQTWRADGNSLNAVRATSGGNVNNANAYMCYDNNSAGVVGIGYVGTVCSTSNFRAVVSEWFLSDVVAGQVLAHELGHNMAMNHDFGATTNTIRRDSLGRSCTNVGGVMDYRSPVSRWSTCSVEDFRNYRSRNCAN